MSSPVSLEEEIDYRNTLKENLRKSYFGEKVDGKRCYALPFAEEHSDEQHSVGR
jgi:hypothetical protein